MSSWQFGTFGAAALHALACAPAPSLCCCSPQVLFTKLDLQLAPLGNMHFQAQFELCQQPFGLCCIAPLSFKCRYDHPVSGRTSLPELPGPPPTPNVALEFPYP